MITQQLLQEIFSYEDGNLYRKKVLGGEAIGKKAGWTTVCNGRLYRKINVYKKTVYLHRMIFLFHYGYQPKYIDHINGDSLDNRIENLRPATQSQNCANQGLKKNNTSGYKGVRYRKDTGKWAAMVMVNRKAVSLGCYENIEDAAKAYEQGAKRFFGEFAKTDQVDVKMPKQ